jgi:tetratricopeptide (TPR) repeat protein
MLAVALALASCTADEAEREPVGHPPASNPAEIASTEPASDNNKDKTPATDPETIDAAGAIRELNDSGLKLYKEKRFLDAAAKFQEALALEPENKILKQNTSRAYAGAANAFSAEKEYQRALENLYKAKQYSPDDAMLQVLIAHKLFYLKRHNEARAECEKILERNPGIENSTSASAQKLLGEVLLTLGDKYGALREWDVYLTVHNDGAIQRRVKKIRREMEVEEKLEERGSARFTIRFDGSENPGIGSAVLTMLEDAYTQIGGALNYYTEEPIEVVLYPKQIFYSLTGSYGWVGALYDGRIKIPVRNFEKHRGKIARTVRHEFTHALIYRITSKCPAWLHEGLAQYFEGVDLAAAEKVLKTEKDKIISFESMPSNFTSISDKDRVGRYYRQSYSFTAYLISTYGIDRLAALLELLKKKNLEEAFKDAFQRSLKELEKEWKEALP